MPFFAPQPEPAPEPEPDDARRFYAFEWQEPEHVLAGLGPAGLVLARSATTALQLAVVGVYPQGLALAVRARFHPEHVDDGPPRHATGPMDDLRFGLQWPDGARVEVGEAPDGQDQPPGGFRLDVPRGGGGDLGQNWAVWLWPLPPPGPVTVHVLWERRGIPETAVELDLAPIIRWADGAVPLWPLPDSPPEGAWRAYAPLARGWP